MVNVTQPTFINLTIRNKTMKVFSEEQVRVIIGKAQLLDWDDNFHFDEDYLIENSESIHIDSDEELEAMAKDVVVYNDTKRGWYIEGLKCMRDKIFGKENKNHVPDVGEKVVILDFIISEINNELRTIESLEGSEIMGRKISLNFAKRITIQAKSMHEKEAFEIFKAGQDSMEEGGKVFYQWYKEKFR
jgi:hypothetical protein